MQKIFGMMMVGAALLLSFTARADHDESGRHRRHEPAPLPLPAPAPQAAPTQISVVPPEKGTVTILDGETQLGQLASSATLSVKTGKTYDVLAARGPLVLWRGSILATGGTIELIWTNSPSPTISVTPPVVTIPVPQKPQGPFETPRHRAMKKEAFESLVALLEATSFEKDKLDVVKTAASKNRFSIAQVGEIVDTLSFSSGKLAAVEALVDRVVDPENGFLLAQHFTFSSDKKKVASLFVR